MIKRMPQPGFTFVETLTVCAILAVLLAVLLPVIGRAKLSAKKATAISNLRQCGLALTLYEDEYGSGAENAPTGIAAANALGSAPTCDPNDYWRSSCSENFGPPLIGSYGYARDLSMFQAEGDWITHLNADPNPTLMACIFYAPEKILPFQGEVPDFKVCGPKRTCILPGTVLLLKADTSAKVKVLEQRTYNPDYHEWLFTWQAVLH